MKTGNREQNEAGNLGFEQVAERAVAHGRCAESEQQLHNLPKAARSALRPHAKRLKIFTFAY